MLDIQMTVLSTLLYGFGALGFIAITALPVRWWQLIHRQAWAIHRDALPRISYVALAASGAIALVFSGYGIYRVSRCLLGYHCSATGTGGWLFLAIVGLSYAMFELFAAIIVRTGLGRARN